VPSPTVFDLTGRAPRSVKDCVDEHVQLFAAPAAPRGQVIENVATLEYDEIYEI
jgi:hypothetical protein